MDGPALGGIAMSSGELAALFKKWLVPDKINPQ